ncbi:MAG: flippase [Minisyncoccia bacterium]
MEIDNKEQINATVLDYFTNWQTFWFYIKEKIQHPGVQKHGKNMGWMFTTKITSMAISFIATAYIARHLGPMNYGELSYAMSFVGLFGFIAVLGIDQILYRDLIKYPEKRNEYMGTALTVRIIASIIAVMVCTLGAFIFSPRDVSLFLIFIISLTFIFSSFQLLSYEFQAEIKSKYPSIISLVIVLILNILKIIVIFNSKGVIYLAGIVLLEPILYSIGFLYFRIKKFGTIKYWRFDKNIAISILKDSSPLIFSSVFLAIYARIDQVMIKNMMDAGSVGLYSSAVTVSEVWYFIPNIIVSALFPAIINAKLTSDGLYKNRLKKLTSLLFVFSLIASIFTSIFAPIIIKILYGSAFIGGITVLQIYVWSLAGTSLSNLIMNYLVAQNYRRISLLINILPMIINVILNIIWIPKYGIIGAALATLISYSIGPFVLLLFKKTRSEILEIIKA